MEYAHYCDYWIHAEGPEDRVDELVARFTEDGHTPHFLVEHADSTELAPRSEGTKLVEISGRCDFVTSLDAPSIIQRPIEGRYNANIAILEESTRDLGLTVEAMCEITHRYHWSAGKREGGDRDDSHSIRYFFSPNRFSPTEYNIVKETKYTLPNGWEVDAEGHKTFEEYAKAKGLPRITKPTDDRTPGYHGYSPWFHEDASRYDERQYEAALSAGPTNRRIQIHIVDKMPDIQPGGKEWYAEATELLLAEDRYQSEAPMTVKAMDRQSPKDNYGSGGNLIYSSATTSTLRKEAIDWGEVSPGALCNEITFVQGYRTSTYDPYGRHRGVIYATRRRIVPSGQKRVWAWACDPLRPKNMKFVNIELAFDPSKGDYLTAPRMGAEALRALRRICGEKIADVEPIGYLRVTQRPAKDKQDMGAHVFSCLITEDLLKDWGGYPQPADYGHPTDGGGTILL